MEKMDYAEKYNGVRNVLEEVVLEAKTKINDMKDEVNRKVDIRNGRIEELEENIKMLEGSLEEAKHEASTKAENYAYSMVERNESKRDRARMGWQ